MNTKNIETKKQQLTTDVKNALKNSTIFEHNLVVAQQLDETGEKWGVRIGSKLACEEIFATKEETELFISKRPFKIQCALIGAIIDAILNQKKYGNNKQQNDVTTGGRTEV